VPDISSQPSFSIGRYVDQAFVDGYRAQLRNMNSLGEADSNSKFRLCDKSWFVEMVSDTLVAKVLSSAGIYQPQTLGARQRKVHGVKKVFRDRIVEVTEIQENAIRSKADQTCAAQIPLPVFSSMETQLLARPIRPSAPEHDGKGVTCVGVNHEDPELISMIRLFQSAMNHSKDEALRGLSVAVDASRFKTPHIPVIEVLDSSGDKPKLPIYTVAPPQITLGPIVAVGNAVLLGDSVHDQGCRNFFI